MSQISPQDKLAAVEESRQVGQLEGMMEDEPQYILIAYRVYPNGATADEFVTDPKIAAAIGRKTGLGTPTDPKGWGLWKVGEAK